MGVCKLCQKQKTSEPLPGQCEEAKDRLLGWLDPVLLALREDGEENILMLRDTQLLSQRFSRLAEDIKGAGFLLSPRRK